MARRSTNPPAKPSHANDASYFSRLTFDPKLATGFIAQYINNIRLVILAIITIALLGFVSYTQLPKRLNPEVEIPIVSVVTVLPGASPEDVESLVTVPLEDKLRSAEGLDQINSVSSPNVSIITLQFQSQVKRDVAKDKTQTLVDTVRDLPEDAQDTQVTALDFEDQPIWTFVLTSSADDPTLMNFAQHVESRLEDLSKVDRVLTAGFETQEIVVAADPTKLSQYGLNPLQLSQAVQKGVSAYPGGNVATNHNSFAITINPTLTSINDLRNLQITVNDQVISLGEVATISERPQLEQATALLATNEQSARRAVTFYVYKTTSVSIDEAGHQVEAAMDELLAERPGLFQVTTILNTSHEITDQFNDLLGEFRTTIILVFACLLLFLGLRQAALSSLTVPLTFLSAFVFMRIIGMSINFLSLFAFLLALGLLVDDTIVTVSAMTSYYKTKKFTPLQTGLLVWRDTIVPIWSTTLTTIWSFVPLLLSTGIIGEFIKPIPIVVTVTMISSTAIAVFITLPIMMVILKPQFPKRVVVLLKLLGVLAALSFLGLIAKGNPLFLAVVALFFIWLLVLKLTSAALVSRAQQLLAQPHIKHGLDRARHLVDHGLIDVEGFANGYYRFIKHILSSNSLRWQVIIAILVYAVVSFALVPFGLVKNEFFPKEDQDTIYLNVELPAGTKLAASQQAGSALIEDLRTKPEIDFVVAEVGKQFSSDGSRSNNNNGVLLSIHLPPEGKRPMGSIELSQQLREQYADYPAGRVTVVEVSGGPPAGSDLQIKLSGNDLGKLDSYANQIMDYLEQQPGVNNVDKSIKTGTTQLVFVPDLAKLAESGISVDQIGLWLRLYASGFTLDSVKWQSSTGDSKDIVFRMTDEPSSIEVSSLQLSSNQGTHYPLNSLGTWETRPNPTQITRENGRRTISVSAGTMVGYSTSEQNKKLEEFADTLNLSEGYSWATGGVNEENQKSVNSILQSMGVAAILILVTMVIQFGSFRQALIVLSVIPLAVSSVFLVFGLTGTPLSFPALIGVLSLFGIVVTNSMFIVDKINLNQRQGMPLKEAIADAGASRMEPIILTKLCTVLGLLPITIADPLWRGLGGAIISGLLLSSTIMLLFIPAVYYQMFKGQKK